MSEDFPTRPVRATKWGDLDWSACDPNDIRYWWALSDAVSERESLVGRADTYEYYDPFRRGCDIGCPHLVDMARALVERVKRICTRYVDIKKTRWDEKVTARLYYNEKIGHYDGDASTPLTYWTYAELTRAVGGRASRLPIEGSWHRADETNHTEWRDWMMAFKRVVNLLRHTDISPRLTAERKLPTWQAECYINWGQSDKAYGNANAAIFRCLDWYQQKRYDRIDATWDDWENVWYASFSAYYNYARFIVYMTYTPPQETDGHYHPEYWKDTYWAALWCPQLRFKTIRGSALKGRKCDFIMDVFAWQEYDLNGDKEHDEGKAETHYYNGDLMNYSIAEGWNEDVCKVSVGFGGEVNAGEIIQPFGEFSSGRPWHVLEKPPLPEDKGDETSTVRYQEESEAGCHIRVMPFLDWGVEDGLRFYEEADDEREFELPY